jgi:8-oxo-dGTP pyrophosphatase MutT (NUDIX family)
MKEFGTFDANATYKEREGSYGVAILDDKVLIDIAKLGYFLPGGGLGEVETPEEALQREFREESGYELQSWQSMGTAIEYREGLKKIGHFYLVELGTKGEPTYEDGHVFPVEWILIKDVKERMHLESQWRAIEEGIKLHHTN